MTAGLCGKRLEFEETFGSPASAPSAKRFRCSNSGSPIRIVEVGAAGEDKISVLLRMFPSMDTKVVSNSLAEAEPEGQPMPRGVNEPSLSEQTLVRVRLV